MEIRKYRRQNKIQLILLILILITVNILGNYIFRRIDMTQEKRYSLSPASKNLARELKDVVFFRIYLDGDLPPGFKRLKNSLKELLDEYRIYSGDNIQYEFIDPSASSNEKERSDLYHQLANKGLFPTSLEEKNSSGESQKIIFPGALVNYRSKEFPLQVLKSRMGSSPEQMLNNSVENLEYEISSLLRKILLQQKPFVVFLQGQNELPTSKLTDAMNALSDFYEVDTVEIKGQLSALKNVKTLIIAGPTSAFDEKDKFVIDQFIMHGGHILWLIDQMNINMDSLSTAGTNIALPFDLNLDDILFKYGIRINLDLVLDLQAAQIPIVTGYVGNQPRQQLFQWYYSPLLESESNHPVVNNLNAIRADFLSSVDTIETENATKTILLASGKYSRMQMSPARVSLNILRDKPEPSMFNRHSIPVAVLLEGKFSSAYVNRIPPQIASSPEIDFKNQSAQTSMIVMSDADVISNYVSKKGVDYPLGYDRFTGETFGNRNFILNCVDYLTGNKEILAMRSKEFRLRLLDNGKISSPQFIQWTNLFLPSIIIIVFGLIFNFIRRKKYSN